MAIPKSKRVVVDRKLEEYKRRMSEQRAVTPQTPQSDAVERFIDEVWLHWPGATVIYDGPERDREN